MKKLLYILISTTNLLLLSSEHNREYTKNTCHRTFSSNRLFTEKEREENSECRYHRFEVYDKIANKHIAHIAYNPHRCSIEYLRVDEAYKKQGIGAELAKKALEELKNHGCEEVALFSTVEGRGFWQKLGAKEQNGKYVFSDLS